mgnify:CR=1 FL=1
MGRITLASHFDRFPFVFFEAAPMLGDAQNYISLIIYFSINVVMSSQVLLPQKVKAYLSDNSTAIVGELRYPNRTSSEQLIYLQSTT